MRQGAAVQSVVAMMGWPEIIGILVIFVLILGAKEIPEVLKGKRHGVRGFKHSIREIQQEVAEFIETGAAGDDGKAYRLHELIFWLFVALAIALVAMAFGQ